MRKEDAQMSNCKVIALINQNVKIAASEPVARRKRATHAGEVSHAISRKKLHGKI